MKKTVYFIRHGETRSNHFLRHERDDNEPLNEKGREEARRAGEALRAANVETVLSSDSTRTRETARIIRDVLGLSCEREELTYLQELRRPTFVRGRSLFFSCVSLGYFLGFLTGVAFDDDRRAGAETLSAFKKRLEGMLALLALREESRIAVVTHRGVMAGVTPLLRRGGSAPLWRFVFSLFGAFAVDNAEITVAEFDGTCWRLIALNTNKHLEE